MPVREPPLAGMECQKKICARRAATKSRRCCRAVPCRRRPHPARTSSAWDCRPPPCAWRAARKAAQCLANARGLRRSTNARAQASNQECPRECRRAGVQEWPAFFQAGRLTAAESKLAKWLASQTSEGHADCISSGAIGKRPEIPRKEKERADGSRG